MKAQHLLLAATVAVTADAYTTGNSGARKSTFVGRQVTSTARISVPSLLRMDSESDVIDPVARFNLEQRLRESSTPFRSLEHAEAQHGMPWKSSIDPKVKDDDLLYMRFWEWQMQFMKDNLTDLRVMPCTNGKRDFAFNENGQKKARIVNLCASSKEYHKIRMTYYDAGDNTQVFNSVWYPDPAYNLPVLGIDLLAFNRKKYLAIVDFQPLHQDENDHSTPFEHLLQPIKEEYDTLKGRMSSKFYDETQFFSQQMLFARFEDEGVVSQDLFPAFSRYVETHLNLLRSTTPVAADVSNVLARQQAYDTYSAERDPATGLFAAMFGADWAADFVHDFLFSSSTRPETFVIPAMPGAPPPKQGGGGNPFAQGGDPHAGVPTRPFVAVAASQR
jgi:15,16-dihydrobiliverdin:ferredoxin oxidoreductase